MLRSGRGLDDGFSLVELLVSTALLLMILATVGALVDPVRGDSIVQFESADLQQRLRVAASALINDLTMAGAGPYAGQQSGALTSWFAPLLPYRYGGAGADPPGSYRSDAVTVLFVPATSHQTTLSTPLGPGQSTLHVNQESSCPRNLALCGFRAGMTLLVIDGVGHFDTLVLTSTSGSSGQVAADRPGGALQTIYQSGARVSQVIQRTYYVKTSAVDNGSQLVYDEPPAHVAVPVVDHIARVTFDYYGDSQPPILIRPIDDPSGPSTSYGPPPPAPGLQPTGYPPGENCAFALDPLVGAVIPRLSVIGADEGRHSLVLLTAAELADGDVWCPDGDASSRFDADLLRVRKIAVVLRIESAIDALRGPAGTLFSRSGTARGERRFLPDREIRFEVTPPNLNLGASP